MTTPKQSWPDFPYCLDRTLEDQGEIGLAIEVTHYHPPGNNRGLDSRDPAFDGGEVSFGHAVNVATGNTIELTRMEWEAVETAFWNL